MLTKIIIANWKMNPTSLEEARELFGFSAASANRYSNLQLVVCPPFIYLEELAKQIDRKSAANRVSLGAQDLFWEKTAGPYTGEVSADMLKEFGVTHVLVGHSDRRYKIGETDEIINKKIKAALEADIVPVLLVGEKNREDDRAGALEKQLAANLEGLTPSDIGNILIAYEPVWAISTNPGAEPDRPENTIEAIRIINDFLARSYGVEPKTCLYGGSINEKNAVDFLKNPEISGAVIGGASLRKEEFAEILRIVTEL